MAQTKPIHDADAAVGMTLERRRAEAEAALNAYTHALVLHIDSLRARHEAAEGDGWQLDWMHGFYRPQEANSDD